MSTQKSTQKSTLKKDPRKKKRMNIPQCECGSYATNIDEHNLRCDVCYYKIMLFDLLTVIHQDEGQCTESHGIEKSWEQGMSLSASRLSSTEV